MLKSREIHRENDIRFVVGPLAMGSLAGRASIDTEKPAGSTLETQECMTYRSMMTAPMPPDAHERLRLACESLRTGGGLAISLK